MNAKYKLINKHGSSLKRLIALRSFGKVKEGDQGGLIAKEDNLSHDGDCWVFETAKVFGNARVSGNARVYGNAEVYGNARVSEKAKVYGDAEVHGNAEVYGNARVHGDAEVYGNARVYGDAKLEKSEDVKCLTGFTFPITITPQNAIIGCQSKTHEEWLGMSKKEAVQLELPEHEYFPLKGILKIIFKTYEKKIKK